MKVKIIAAIVIASFASTACSTAKKPEPDRRLHIEYANQDWRLCQTVNCKSTSKKTIYLYEPEPVVIAPPPPLPSPPIPSEIAAVADSSPMIVHFAFGTAHPTKEGERELNDVLKRSLTNTEAIAVTGYTDSKGPLKVNERLARKRAIFIVNWLKNYGSTNKFRVNSKGRCCYVQANKSEAGMAKNRRSEIIFKGATSDTSHTSHD